MVPSHEHVSLGEFSRDSFMRAVGIPCQGSAVWPFDNPPRLRLAPSLVDRRSDSAYTVTCAAVHTTPFHVFHDNKEEQAPNVSMV